MAPTNFPEWQSNNHWQQNFRASVLHRNRKLEEQSHQSNLSAIYLLSQKFAATTQICNYYRILQIHCEHSIMKISGLDCLSRAWSNSHLFVIGPERAALALPRTLPRRLVPRHSSISQERFPTPAQIAISPESVETHQNCRQRTQMLSIKSVKSIAFPSEFPKWVIGYWAPFWEWAPDPRVYN